jgi:crossover junction endodeoxyribonuclease RusA
MVPFEFVIPSRPVSQQTRRRDRLHEWRRYVQGLAAAAWTPSVHTRPTGAAALSLLYLYDEVPLDADNIVKPIQDALVGVVLDDDHVVSDVVVRRRRLRTSFVVDGVTPLIAAALERGGEFIFVRLEDAPEQDQLL